VSVVRCLLALLMLAPLAHARDDLRDGDLVFQTSRSRQSEAIQRATHSPYSHVGIVLFRDGKPYVFEAVASVRYTPLDAWIARGEQGRHVVKRLRRHLTPVEVAKLHASAKPFAGRPYDLYFEWSDARIYCSELVWKMYRQALGVELGTRQKLREFDLQDPVVAAKLQQRYGKLIPLEEPVISPAAVFDSKLLQTIPTD
jgi:cell wall-associated NlpC family hydrolase